MEGDRFKTKSVPVEFLQELSIIQELIFEIAKDIYRNDHTTKRRLPNHFLDGISFRLVDIRKGSSIMDLELDTSEIQTLELNNDTYAYLEKAKALLISDVEKIDVDNHESILSNPKIANYFTRIGKHLRPNEIMFLNRSGRKKLGKLTDEIRNKIINKPFHGLTINTFEVYAEVTSIDKKNRTFTIDTSKHLINASLDLIEINLLMKSLGDSESVTQIFIKGTGRYDVRGRLQIIDSVDSAVLIDPFDFRSRIDELVLIEDGWLEGEGKAPDSTSLLKFLHLYEQFVPKTFIKPAIFPRPDGNIQFEWSSEEYEIHAVIDLETYESTLHSLNVINMKEKTAIMDLTKKAGWKSLNFIINESL